MKKILALLCAVALFTLTLPVFAQTPAQVAGFVDELNSNKDNFLNSGDKDFISQRIGISPNAMEWGNSGGTQGTAYIRPGGYLLEESYLMYRVNPKYSFKAEAFKKNSMADCKLSIYVSSDKNNWSLLPVEPISLGTVKNENGSNTWLHEEYRIIVPDDAYYAKVCLPDGTTYTNWTMGIMNVSMSSAEFVDELDSAVSDFTNSTKAGYISQRIACSPHAMELSALGGRRGNIYMRPSGYVTEKSFISYRSEAGCFAAVEYFDNQGLGEGAIRIFSSPDNITYSQVGSTTVQMPEIDGAKCYMEYATMPENSKFMMVLLPDDGSKYIHWKVGIMSVELRNNTFVDGLDVEKNKFLDSTVDGYVMQREQTSQNEISENNMGGTIGIAYQHVPGWEANPAYISYRVTPGQLLNVIAHNSTKSNLTIYTSADGVNWVQQVATVKQDGNLNDSNNTTYRKEIYSVVIPNGMYYAKIAIPGYKDNNGNAIFSHWCLGICQVELKNPIVNEFVYTDPNDTADFGVSKVTVSGSIAKNSTNKENISVIFASYDKNNHLVGVDIKSQEINKNTIIYELSVDIAAKHIIYLWHGEMIPIASSIPIISTIPILQ